MKYIYIYVGSNTRFLVFYCYGIIVTRMDHTYRIDNSDKKLFSLVPRNLL